MTGLTRIAHLAAIALMAAGVLVATGVGFAQSWAGLYDWATDHGLEGWKAKSFPAMVDLFILIGELGLFALTLEGHRLTKQGMAWVDLALPGSIATAGWGVSLAFNVGHVDHELSDQITAAVPPIASMLGLLVLLRTLHRLVGRAGDRDTGHVPEVPGLEAEPVAEPWDETAPAGLELWETAATAPPAITGPVTGDPGLEWLTATTGPAPVAAIATTEQDRDRSPETGPEVIATTGHDDPTGETTEPAPVATGPQTDPEVREAIATARDHFADMLAAGRVPSIRSIRQEIRVGHPRAQLVREALSTGA